MISSRIGQVRIVSKDLDSIFVTFASSKYKAWTLYSIPKDTKFVIEDFDPSMSFIVLENGISFQIGSYYIDNYTEVI